MPVVADLVQALQEIAPPERAAGWDNVGLLLGDSANAVQRVVTCLTVTPASAAEAVDAGAQMIVTHHPVLFRPTQRLTAATVEGRTLLPLLRAGVAVYSPHSAFDDAPGGINDVLAAKLGMTQVVPLRAGLSTPQCKIVVFVPDADLGRVGDALFAAGAGRIGQYRECSFRLAGTGTFFGADATNPTVGQKGRREEVEEWRLEAICTEAMVDVAVAAMRQAHSYEEPAYDVYPLRPARAIVGTGRVGLLAQPAMLADFAAQVKHMLAANCMQIVGEPALSVRRVAIACGAAGEFIGDAVRAEADVFLTGEVRFHDCLAAQAQGLALVLPGHYATERCGVESLAARLQQRFPSLEVWASRHEADPLRCG
jgi:dinuclear metal center YbgI/SA1388 family protein